MKAKDIKTIFDEHRCPKCRKYDLMFYYPFMRIEPGVRPYQISQEVECEDCGWSLFYNYDIANIKVVNK